MQTRDKMQTEGKMQTDDLVVLELNFLNYHFIVRCIICIIIYTFFMKMDWFLCQKTTNVNNAGDQAVSLCLVFDTKIPKNG